MSDEKTPRQAAAAAMRGLVSGVGQNVTDRVRQELAASKGDGEVGAKPTVAAALSGLASGVGQNVSELVRQELGTARSEVVQSAKAAARGAGLLGGAAATGNTAVLFVGVAVWRGLGNRIGFAKSALVVAALSGAASAVLASNGMSELARVQRLPRLGGRKGPTGKTEPVRPGPRTRPPSGPTSPRVDPPGAAGPRPSPPSPSA